MIDGDGEAANILNKTFVSIVQKLGIVTEKSNVKLTELYLDESRMATTNYKNYAI